MGKLRALAALVLAATALPLGAIQQTQTVTLGNAPIAAYADAPTGKLFVAHEGRTRATSNLAVLERGGRLSTLPLEGSPIAMAGSAALRRLVVLHGSGTATLVHLDSLKVTPIAVAGSPVRVALSDRAGEAYVLGRQGSQAVVTAIDLKTLSTRTGLIRDAAPVALAVHPGGGRLYVLATRPGDEAAGFVQALDPRTLSATGDAVPAGRMPLDLAIAAGGESLAVLDHQALAEAGSAAPRAELRILGADLAMRRVVALPEGRFVETRGMAYAGEVVPDAAGIKWWVRDARNARLETVDSSSGAVAVTDLEAPAAALAFNAAAGTLLAVMPQAGVVAVVSPLGERLDSVPIGHPATDTGIPPWPIAIDAQSGDAYVGHGTDGTMTVLPKAADAAALANLTDLWFNPAEPGWGAFIDQQSTTAFAALFTYGAGGEASWLVMSNGTRQPDGSFSGVLYRTQGPTQGAATNISPVGFMRLMPGADGLTMTYVADGNSVTRRLQRFAFGAAPAACRWSTTDAPPAKPNFTAMWSNPADPGWGLAVSQRGSSVFALLFAYDDQNRPSWMVMSNGRQVAPGQFSGDLYRVSRAKVESAGAMTLRFSASDEGSVAYRMNGTEFHAPLLRYRFAPLVSRCGG